MNGQVIQFVGDHKNVKNASHRYLDGRIAVVPVLYFQLYTSHVTYLNHILPAFYASQYLVNIGCVKMFLQRGNAVIFKRIKHGI